MVTPEGTETEALQRPQRRFFLIANSLLQVLLNNVIINVQQHFTGTGGINAFINLTEMGNKISEHSRSEPVKKQENTISESVGVLQLALHGNKCILFTHTCCLPVKSLQPTAGPAPPLSLPHRQQASFCVASLCTVGLNAALLTSLSFISPVLL